MPPRILVVDDSQQKLARIVEALIQTGLDRNQIDIAQTGVDARTLLTRTRYDLLILDIALPLRAEEEPDRRGGIKLLEEVEERSIYQLPLSVVGLTAFSDLFEETSSHFRSKLWTLDLCEPSDNSWIDRLKAKINYIVSRAEQPTPHRFETDLCVITGLAAPELEALRKVEWGWSSSNSLDEVGYFYKGHFKSGGVDRSVVAAAAPRMGMVSSAILSMKLMLRFRPRILVMVGICAGVRGNCTIGDVLVADPSWDWQMGKYATKKFQVAPDHIDIPTAVAERCVQLAEDRPLWFEIHSTYPGSKPNSLPTVRVGPVTSGSAVLADETLLKEIKEVQNRKLLGVDMELYGMYAASRDCSPPNPIAFGMKSVCDFADNNKSDDYQGYAAHVSVHTLAAFCERYAVDFLQQKAEVSA